MKDPFRQALEISRRSGPHVEDVRRLLVFHGVDYGAPDSLAIIEAKLANSNAFRTDLSALARHISDLEHRIVTDDEMQTLIELAVGGKQLIEEPAGSTVLHDTNPRTPLAETGARTGSDASDITRTGVAGTSAETRTTTDLQESPSAAVRDSTPKPAFGAAAGPSSAATAAETGGSQGGLELAIAELKIYLNDIDRRIGRLEPRLEDLTRLVQNSADRLQPHDAEEPSYPDPPLADQQQLSTDPPTRTAALRLPEEPDLRHRGAPLLVALAHPPREDAPPTPASSPVPGPAPPAEPIRLAGTAQLRTWEHMTAPIDHGRSSSSTRQTVGRFLGVAAVLLAIVGGIAALYAFGNPGENATTAQTGNQPNQGGSPTADRGRSAPETSETTAQQTITASAPPSVQSESRLGSIRGPESSLAQPKAIPSQPSSPALSSKPGISTRPPAKVAGKRSEPIRQEPRIEIFPTALAPPRRATDSENSRTQHVASRTDDGGMGKSAANSSPAGLVSRAGTPEVESHSSQGSLISSKTPVYPPEALSQHKEGTVVLDALIAKDGSVKRMDVVEGSPGFTRSALNAVSWWRYKPTHARGEPAETQARITVNYRIR